MSTQPYRNKSSSKKQRSTCAQCLRPLNTCLCKHIQTVANQVELIILQHPLEEYEVKNTGRLLHLCLKNSQIFVGESFSDTFFTELQTADKSIYNLLVYPDTPDNKSLTTHSSNTIDSQQFAAGDNLHRLKHIRLWVLDATWRKSRKMLYLNSVLKEMPRLSLQNCPPSLYKIRKAHSENQLSTLEASCYALQQLEQGLVDYSPVINAFSAFIAEQQTFLPTDL